ncbi:alpha/beta hydrolase [Kribbella karoonensis]|uniref:Alpha/beta hydrolase n=1 Tax=Kribbella karoonensis TaxID=324851 RepID=A0ABN2CSS3_9ACTN
MFEGWEYYCTPRGRHERSTKTLPWISVDRIATFDAVRAVDRPLLMIAGRKAVTSWMSVEAFQKARGPKRFVWIDDATHVDLYDRDEYVTPAVAEIRAFFAESLG